MDRHLIKSGGNAGNQKVWKNRLNSKEIFLNGLNLFQENGQTGQLGLNAEMESGKEVELAREKDTITMLVRENLQSMSVRRTILTVSVQKVSYRLSLNHGLNGEAVQALVAKVPEPGQGNVQVRLIVLAIQLSLTNVLTIHLAAVNA